MTKSFPVLLYSKLDFDIWRTNAEAQAIMVMRIARMGGLGTLGPGETTRMLSELQEAFADAMMRAGTKALQGQRPNQVSARGSARAEQHLRPFAPPRQIDAKADVLIDRQKFPLACEAGG